ncbi:hypothetical protein CN307_26355 [Bacillus cereus]|uniref:Uncharacterized protein n=2 Tax=Bacillus cereus TaxID=1396 RepID=A0A2A8ZSY5_BACCE|nr:hypothetical protein CN307_26355 [Bacillus cereus]
MLYKNLNWTLQRSIRMCVRRTMVTLLNNADYRFLEEGVSIVTDSFVCQVVADMMEERSFQGWSQFDFEIDDVEMKELIQKIEHSMRKRNSTLKQRNYYRRLLIDLRLNEDIPTDYLYMKKRLREMQAVKKELKRKEMEKKPATFTEIQKLKKM